MYQPCTNHKIQICEQTESETTHVIDGSEDKDVRQHDPLVRTEGDGAVVGNRQAIHLDQNVVLFQKLTRVIERVHASDANACSVCVPPSTGANCKATEALEVLVSSSPACPPSRCTADVLPCHISGAKRCKGRKKEGRKKKKKHGEEKKRA
jgi:hypothetical protein